MAKKKIDTNTNKIFISEKSIFMRNTEDFLITEVDGETVMMNTINGTYWGLNSTSTDIWNMLESSKTLKDIISHLLKEYDVNEDICRQETIQVLVNMLQTKIIKIDNSNIEKVTT